ncbi:hypothetical protein V5O48_004906 [Marasmius crinis-equi]|uniref:Uncharacterized protein n=1 Tax=Marasmius crinis-equi TaxID=585013 RepID=A0ABR3FNP8_9AGAR
MPLPRTIADPPPTVHRADLFFGAASSSTPPRHQSQSHRHTSFSAVAPTPISHSESLHRSRTAPAPVPPPPPLPPIPGYPPRNSSLPEPPSPRVPRPPPSVPRSSQPSDESEFEAAIKLSRTESENQALRLEKLEEEELARALEESLKTARPQDSFPWSSSSSSHGADLNLPSSASSNAQRSPSVVPLPVSPPVVHRSGSEVEQLNSSPAMSSHSPRVSRSNATTPSVHDDEVFARQLAEREEAEVRANQQPAGGATLEDDEALARRLAAEENEDMKDDNLTNSGLPALPPTYDDAVSPRPAPRPQSSDRSSLSVDSATPRTPSSTSLNSVSTSSDNQSYNMPLVPLRPTQSDTNIAAQNTNLLDPAPSPPLPSSASLPGKVEAAVSSSSTPDTPPINANQFLDTELLRGVSIGWNMPLIGPQMPTMQGPMPNIISLPYGRCPPLHFQTPNWRHLLMLMARLPGTRVEPTVEAMAQNKFDMRLRTVIQFVRPHHNSNDWRTVIWLTIDTPVPPGPQNRKFSNNDVDTLPYSYTLSPVPTLLQNNPDTPISKVYTVPSTDSKPYPVLPITFPNLALYLQATLEESRRYMSDSSSGFRKLTKMTQVCYPNAYEADNGSEGGGMGKYFKVFGRKKQNGRTSQRGGNEDVYELVTPFVADEWG